MIEKTITLRCDTPDCTSQYGPFTGRTSSEVRSKAKERGWGVSGNEDRCPIHRNPRTRSST